MNMKKLTQEGFTLVELMVVVAIIGILAAIAIPNYQKYQARSRQSEAKIALAGIYTAETSFAVENNSFSGCLINIGYSPDGFTVAGTGQTNRYYTVGFKAVPAAGCGPNAGSTCLGYQWASGVAAPVSSCVAGNGVSFYQANSDADTAAYTLANVQNVANIPFTVAAAPFSVGNNGAADLQLGQSSFVAGANGMVSTHPTVAANPNDQWQIDQSKNLINTQQSI